MKPFSYPRRTFLRLALAGSGALILNACNNKEADGPLPGVNYYTCSMHTWVRASAPGKCPVCGMTLIPVMKRSAQAAAAAGATEFTVPPGRQQEIGVTYTAVERRPLRRTMTAVGTVEYDRQRAWVFEARTDGYVERLFVTSPGQTVAVNQPLLSFYSPDLLAAERKYVALLAAHGAPAGALAEARGQLRQLGVTDDDLAELEQSRKPSEEVTLRSPLRGVVKELAAEQGANVKAGDRLAEVADLSRVWVWAAFYEADLAAVRLGQKAAVTAGAYPGETFEGEVSLIDPFLDEGTRAFKVRIDLANADLKLRPGMYADVAVESQTGPGLVIPLDAVMPTGKRNVVFVDKGEGRLEPRNVTLGGEYDGCYEVTEGVKEGERIVSSAVFLIDAEAHIQGALKGFDGAGEAAQ
jgi:Cu(I)/Ag(I) efflux system membrane fusion protein